MSENIRPDQIPYNAMIAVGLRMTKGFEKHGDYRKRLEEHGPKYWWDHMLFHIAELKKGNRYTGSGDSHADAIICDAMLYKEALLLQDKRKEAEDLEREMLTEGKQVNKEEG
jgi:hypothetical protein